MFSVSPQLTVHYSKHILASESSPQSINKKRRIFIRLVCIVVYAYVLYLYVLLCSRTVHTAATLHYGVTIRRVLTAATTLKTHTEK